MGLTSTQFRIEVSLANDERRMLDVARAKSLKEDGLGPTAIGREMGIPESTVRSLLNPNAEARMNQSYRHNISFMSMSVQRTMLFSFTRITRKFQWSVVWKMPGKQC